MTGSIRAKIDELVGTLAKKMNLTPEEYRARVGAPKFLSETEKIALSKGTDAKTLLDADLRAALDSKYPGPECLTPNEIEELIVGERNLNPDRVTHWKGCGFCTTMVQICEPQPDRISHELKWLTAKVVALIDEEHIDKDWSCQL